MPFIHTPEAVREYAARGRLAEWVHAFLEGEGNNRPMSDGLRLQPRFWLGPALVSLDRLQRCMGPEPTMEYVTTQERWDQRIAPMVAAVQQGWAPPPLIAQVQADGSFSIRDGNHRHETLRRAGFHAYWCVVWCDSESQCQSASRILADEEKALSRQG